MENLKNLIQDKDNVRLASMLITTISITSIIITIIIYLIEKNKLQSELTPDQFKNTKKNIDNTIITMWVFLGLIVFFGLIMFLV